MFTTRLEAISVVSAFAVFTLVKDAPKRLQNRPSRMSWIARELVQHLCEKRFLQSLVNI